MSSGNFTKVLQTLRSSSLLRATSIYGLSSMANSMVTFILMPIMTRLMTPADYGTFTIFVMVTSVLTTITLLNLQGALSVRFYRTSTAAAQKYSNASAILICFSFVLFASVSFLFRSELQNRFNFPSEWLVLGLIFTFSQVIVTYGLTIFQMQEKVYAFVTTQLVLTLANNLLSISLLRYFHLGWLGRAMGLTIAYCAVAIFIAYKLYASHWLFSKSKPEQNDFKEALAYGLPLMPHAMAGLINSLLDRFFISGILGTAQTGVYAVGLQIGSLITMVQTAFNQAWVPWLFRKLSDPKEKDKVLIVKFTYLYFFSILVFALILGFGAPYYLPYFAGKEFSGASSVIIWIALAGAFDGMYKMVGNYLFFREKTGILSSITLGSIALNTLLMPVMVTKYGSLGAAYSLATVNGFYFLTVWIVSSHVVKMPWLNFYKPRKE